MVNGHVIGRERVVFAPDVFRQLLERVGREMLVALEHHVLEEMGEAAPAIRVVLGADVVPHLDRHSGALVIFNRVNLKPVRQRRVFELDLWSRDLRGRFRCRCRR